MPRIPDDPSDQRLLLNALPGVGPVTARRLREAFGGDLGLALRAPRTELLKIKGVGPAMVEALQGHDFDPSAERERAARHGLRILTELDAGWPEALAPMWDPPLALYAEGGALPTARAIAIVGSRRCTPYGTALARRLASELAGRGWWIISGLARGIDQAAHEGALEGGGWTAAVLGHGLERTHPPEALALRRRIAARGCILSEFPIGRPPDRQSFPQRNRLVAALCQAVVVVETDTEGGSLITARFAMDLGRPVCAAPGRADSPASRGCHALIRDGATLVTCAEDVLEELGERTMPRAVATSGGEDDAEDPWLRHFGGGEARDAESLALAAGCDPATAAVALTQLEIEGRLRRRLDGRHERA